MRTRIVLGFAVLAFVAPAAAASGPNLLPNPSFENGRAGWKPFGRGFEIDAATAHGGKASLRCANTEAKQTSGAMVELAIDQQKPVPLLLRGWSKAEAVTGLPTSNYSLYCDVEYATDSRPNRVDLPGQHVRFNTGTHGWAFGERIIFPAAPIKSVKVYVLFRRRYTGAVWFDDLYLGALTAGPLTGSVADFAPLPEALVPDGFAPALAKLPRGRMLVHVQQHRTQPYHVDPLRLWLGGKLAVQREKGKLAAVQRELPWQFPQQFVSLPTDAPYCGLWLRKTWGLATIDVATQGKQGSAVRYTIALPKGVAVRDVDFDGWEAAFDDVQVGALDGRIVLSVLTETQSGADRISFTVVEPAKAAAAGTVSRAEVTHHELRADGLALRVASDGWLDGLRISGKDVTDERIANASGDPLATGAGFYVGDLFGGAFQLIAGEIERTDAGLRQRARLDDMGVAFAATYTVHPDRIDIEAQVQDALGSDRALDLVFKLPLAAHGWTWWEDINKQHAVLANKPIKSDVYPWATLTSPDRAAGLTLAIPPNRPCAFRFHVEPADRLFYVRIRLGLTQASKTPGRAAVALTLFRTDGRWGFRDAARRYYAAFPDAFRRIATKEGGWLFACPTAKIPNPQDYAYHECGPAGWQLDEKLGILTCPYRIPTQRQIVFRSLPKSDDEAMAWIQRVASEPALPRNFARGARAKLYAQMMQNCASYNRDGKPYIVRRDNCGADVLPKNPVYNVVYSVNCDPDLFSDRDTLTVGKYELDFIERMLRDQPKLDGVYLDSMSGWVSRQPNYRRDHFSYVDHPLTYDSRTGRLVALGWVHAYEFMAELQRRLMPQGKVVFPNIGRGRKYPFFYFVCDVIGLEGGLRVGDYEERLDFYRTLAYHKPVLVMDYFEVIGRPTRLADRAGFERWYKWCVLYGVHPSVGRSSVEAYEKFGDVYRRFRKPLKLLGAAGWEPVTHAAAGPNVRIERFGDAQRGLYFTVFNPTDKPQAVRLQIDASALGLPADYAAVDALTGKASSARPVQIDLAAGDLAIVAITRD